MTAPPAVTLSDLTILKVPLDSPVVCVVRSWYHGFKDLCGFDPFVCDGRGSVRAHADP